MYLSRIIVHVFTVQVQWIVEGNLACLSYTLLIDIENDPLFRTQSNVKNGAICEGSWQLKGVNYFR